MKPNPFASLNHLTVPVCFTGVSPFCAADRSYPRHITSFRAHNHPRLRRIPGPGDLAEARGLLPDERKRRMSRPMDRESELTEQMQDLGEIGRASCRERR